MNWQLIAEQILTYDNSMTQLLNGKTSGTINTKNIKYKLTHNITTDQYFNSMHVCTLKEKCPI